MADNSIAISSKGHESYIDHKGKHSGLLGWIFSTDHKRIAILYLVAISSWFLIAVLLGFLIRLELLTPGETIVGAQTYNAFFTLHGIIMVFLFVIPAIPAIFGNFFLPIMLGAKDVAFPRLNLFSWYLYIIGGIFVIIAIFLPGGAPDSGWTFYIPYSIRTSTNMIFTLSAAFILGFSSIVTGLNFIVTIHRMRAPGMSWFRMPLFPWALYATGWIQVLVTPIIGITLLLIIVERVFRVGLFDPSLGGDPVLYQHLFWIYSHPAVYIMAVPAMGVITEIITVYSHKTIFGYKAIAFSSLAIALFGSLVWGHHMFSAGMSDTANFIFSLLTFLVAIPSAIKVFNWTATLYKGSIELEPPMLYGLAFIFLFTIGGLTGIMLGTLSLDIHLTDTTFVVGHFHYVIFGTTGFGFIGGLYHWFPKMFGRTYNKKLAKISFWILLVGFNILYFPMFVMGWLGMPRRSYDYLPEYQSYHVISTIGSWILILALIIIVYTFIKALRSGERTHEMNYCGGETLEWKVETPPTHENFDEIPVITGGPYDYKQNELESEVE